MVRGKGNRGLSPRDLRLLPFLLLLVVVGAFLPSLMNRYNALVSIRDEVAQMRDEVNNLRVRLGSLNNLRQQLAQLENEYRSIRWPPDPRTQGAAWIASIAETSGIRVASLEISGGEGFGQGLLVVDVTLRGTTERYEAVRETIERLLASRAILRYVRMQHTGEELNVELRMGVLVPTAEGRK